MCHDGPLPYVWVLYYGYVEWSECLPGDNVETMKARAFALVWIVGASLACGDRSALTFMDDASGEVMVLDSAADAFDSGTTGDGAPDTLNSCQLLVLFFVGCDEERLNECEREYASVSATNQSLIGQSAQCLESSYLEFRGVLTATWPPAGKTCTPSTVPPLLSFTNMWFNGGCEGLNGSVTTNVPTDPGFPVCGGDPEEPACFFGPDNSGATL